MGGDVNPPVYSVRDGRIYVTCVETPATSISPATRNYPAMFNFIAKVGYSDRTVLASPISIRLLRPVVWGRP